mgnify:CR=1 FL=1
MVCNVLGHLLLWQLLLCMLVAHTTEASCLKSLEAPGYRLFTQLCATLGTEVCMHAWLVQASDSTPHMCCAADPAAELQNTADSTTAQHMEVQGHRVLDMHITHVQCGLRLQQQAIMPTLDAMQSWQVLNNCSALVA